MNEHFAIILILLFLILVTTIYFRPTTIATEKFSKYGWDVFWLNLITGWTGIGWIVCEIWSTLLLDEIKDQDSEDVKNKKLLLSASIVKYLIQALLVVAIIFQIFSLVTSGNDERKLSKALNVYEKTMAKEMGVSVKCYQDYNGILNAEGYIDETNMPCSAKENKSIKDYNLKQSEEYEATYHGEIVEPVFTQNCMPRELILNNVSINCFQKANFGDNSKCSAKQLETIRSYFQIEHPMNTENYCAYPTNTNI